MSYANAILFDRPVFEVARLLGILFNQSPEFVMAMDSPRGSRERTALTSLLHHFVEEPPGEARSPIGFTINQNAAIKEFGRTDRGWISQGAKRIEEQIVHDDVARAVSEIGAWIAEGLRLAGVIRRFMGEARIEPDMPNNWRKSKVWETIKALGRSAKRLVKDEEIAAEDLMQIEAFEAEQAANEKARKEAAEARAAASKAKKAKDKARVNELAQRARETRAASMSVTLSNTQKVLSAVTRDATLAKELCALSVRTEGAVPSGALGLVSCETAKQGKGLLLSLFVRTTEKKLTAEKVCKALHKIIKDAGYVTNPRFPIYPYGDGSHNKGGGIWRLDALMLPAGA